MMLFIFVSIRLVLQIWFDYNNIKLGIRISILVYLRVFPVYILVYLWVDNSMHSLTIYVTIIIIMCQLYSIIYYLRLIDGIAPLVQIIF